jgi:hypothetical protein
MGVVTVLIGEQAVAVGFAPPGPGDLPKVVEPFDARGDHDQGVGSDDLRSHEHLERSVDDEERFGRVVVSMRDRAVGTAGELDAVGAERPVAGTGVSQ